MSNMSTYTGGLWPWPGPAASIISSQPILSGSWGNELERTPFPGLLIAIFGVVGHAYGGIIFNNFGPDPTHLYDDIFSWSVECNGLPPCAGSQITEAMPFTTPPGNWVWLITRIDVALLND